MKRRLSDRYVKVYGKALVASFLVVLLIVLLLSCGSREEDFRGIRIDDYAVAVSLSPSNRELATSGYVFLISHDGKYRIINTGVLRGLQTVWNKKGLFIPAEDSNYSFLHNGEIKVVTRQKVHDDDNFLHIALWTGSFMLDWFNFTL